MYQGKPKLKKITQVNLNNPTLYYIDNPGIHSTCEEYFLSLYLPKSSETNSSIIQVSKMRFNKQSNNNKRDSLDRQTPINQDYEPLRKRYGQNEVLDKITQLPV